MIIKIMIIIIITTILIILIVIIVALFPVITHNIKKHEVTIITRNYFIYTSICDGVGVLTLELGRVSCFWGKWANLRPISIPKSLIRQKLKNLQPIYALNFTPAP